MIVSVHQPQYIPWLGYFDKIARSDAFVFLDRVQYKEREFQNRNRIRTRLGSMWLTVPVVTKDKGRQRIDQVRIDENLPWRRKHLLSLQSCYGKSPFFGLYFPFLEQTLAKQWDLLAGLNVHLVKFLLQQLAINTKVYFESELRVNSEKTDRIVDICKCLGADTYLSGAGGKDYLEEDKFNDAGIRLEYQHFIHPEYRQQFTEEKPFLPFMSVLDLLFNEGQNSLIIIGIKERSAR